MALRRRSASISLSPDIGRFVESLVRSGRFASPGEVLEEAVRLMQESEAMRRAELGRLRRDIDEGLAAFRSGAVSDFDPAAVARIRAKGRRLVEARRTAGRRKAS